MYAKNKVGGFLHLAIGEEATIVGAVRAMRDEDYLISHLPLARARAGPRDRPQARDGRAVRQGDRRLRRARRLDAHVRPRAALHGRLRHRRRQPAAGGRDRARVATTARPTRSTRLRVRRRRGQPGHVRRDAEPRGAVEAARRLHGHEQPVRHGHVARAPLAQTDLHKRGEGYGVPGCAATAWTSSTPTRCSSEAIEQVRERAQRRCSSRRVTYRFRGHSMADPEHTAPRSRSRSGASATRSTSRLRGARAASWTTRTPEAARRGRGRAGSTRRSSSPRQSDFPTPTSPCTTHLLRRGP